MPRVVVVGAGLAGHRAALALRRTGFTGEVVVIGEEPHRPYDRPPLSKQLLAGDIAAADCLYPCDGLEVTWLLGTRAAGLDPDRRQVLLADGDAVAYDRLVIATGRRARAWPDLPALEGFHLLRTLDDALALRNAVRTDSRVAIIGAGFIGCEVAATLRRLGVEQVTVIDVAPLPMSALGSEVGERVLRLHEAHGVRFRLGTPVAMFEGSERVKVVRLEDGEGIGVDIVLLALGSRPNSEWLLGSGLELSDAAVVCDEHCLAIGFDDIAAVGDVAAYPHAGATAPLCVEHWSAARDMAEVAAANLLCVPQLRERYDRVPTFWSDQYEVKIKSAGLAAGADSYAVVDEDPQRPSLVVEAFSRGELVGAVVFNRNRTIIEYQRQLEEEHRARQDTLAEREDGDRHRSDRWRRTGAGKRAGA